MIKIKKIQTGEIKNVYNTEYVNGYVKSNTGKPLGKRFTNSWTGILTETTDEDGQQVFTLSAEWEVTTGKGERKPRQPKPQPAATAENDEVENVTEVTEDATNNTPAEDSNEQALIAALKNLRGGAVDVTKVREIVAEELSKLLASDAKKAAKVIEAAKKNSGKKDEVYCASLTE